MDCLLNAVYTSTTSISSNPGQSFKYPLVITFKSLSSMNKGVILLFFGVLLVVGSVGVQSGGITLKRCPERYHCNLIALQKSFPWGWK